MTIWNVSVGSVPLCMYPLGGWRIQNRAAECTVYSPWSKEFRFVRQCEKTAGCTLQHTKQLLSNLQVVWRGTKHVNIQVLHQEKTRNSDQVSVLEAYGVERPVNSSMDILPYRTVSPNFRQQLHDPALFPRRTKHQLHCSDSLTSRSADHLFLFFSFMFIIYFLLWKLIVKCSWVKFKWEEVKCRQV